MPVGPVHPLRRSGAEHSELRGSRRYRRSTHEGAAFLIDRFGSFGGVHLISFLMQRWRCKKPKGSTSSPTARHGVDVLISCLARISENSRSASVQSPMGVHPPPRSSTFASRTPYLRLFSVCIVSPFSITNGRPRTVNLVFRIACRCISTRD